MPIEQIATSNNEQQEAPKNEKLTKVETSNKIDYNLDSINEEKFQQFKEMTDYIKENGWEYEKEYQNIMNNVIKPLEENLNKILDKNKDINSMSDKELADAAEEKMNNQPKKLREQQELIKKINGNWSQEEVQKLNEIVNNNMADVQDFYNKIMIASKWTTMPWEEPDSTPDLWNEWTEWWNNEPWTWWNWQTGGWWWIDWF